MMADILVLNGPNLNMLGIREPEKYGCQTLSEIIQRLKSLTEKKQYTFDDFQSNQEGLIINRIHQAFEESTNFIIINPAAYTHTSIAIRDALLATSIKFIEVHLSNINARENFRHKSYFSDIAYGTICGFGSKGYDMALSCAFDYFKDELTEMR
jgi:3-dehydroquinate dehydratase-2